MALPTKIKTWQIDRNNNSPSAGTELGRNQKTLYEIKTALIGFASNPWTVHSSSDGTTADATDNWGAKLDLVWATGAHSWIVLESVDVQICIDLDVVDSRYFALYISMSKDFDASSATTSIIPTASDRVLLMSTSKPWQSATDTTAKQIVHVLHSSDGAQTWVVVTGSSAVKSLWYFARPSQLLGDWLSPYIWRIANDDAGAKIEYNTGWQVQSEHECNLVGVDTFNPLWGYTLHRCGSSTVGNTQAATGNPLNSDDHDLLPIFIGDYISGREGIHALYDDVYLVNENAGAVGDRLPATGDAEWTQLVDFILPWDNGDAMDIL